MIDFVYPPNKFHQNQSENDSDFEIKKSESRILIIEINLIKTEF